MTLTCVMDSTKEVREVPVEAVCTYLGQGVHGLDYVRSMAVDQKARPDHVFAAEDWQGVVIIHSGAFYGPTMEAAIAQAAA